MLWTLYKAQVLASHIGNNEYHNKLKYTCLAMYVFGLKSATTQMFLFYSLQLSDL